MDIPVMWSLVALFVGLSIAAWASSLMIASRLRLRRRFLAFGDPAEKGGSALGAGRGGERLWSAWIARFVIPLAALSMPDHDGPGSALRRKMVQAGFRGQHSVILLVAARTILTLVLPAAAWLGLRVAGSVAPGVMLQASVMLAAAAIGYLLPGAWLDQRAVRRQRELIEALPDALDLLLVCVEAGLGLDMAIQRVSSELRWRSAALADEFDLVSSDVRAGSPRLSALQRMSQRSGADEIASFVAMLAQADRFGTSVGDALRVQADAMRTARRLRAQERAAKVPVKLLFPLVFCIFPALFTVLLGPAVIRIWRVMLPALQSGA